jgi:hypothetical protein
MKPVVLRKRRERIKSEANWSLFYYYFNKDHAKPNLIWNYKVSDIANKYRILAVMKVETDIITSITARLIGRGAMQVIMLV